jgi:hypothetical protein
MEITPSPAPHAELLPASEPQAQLQAAISPFGRIIGMFFSPKATYEDIVRKPSWVLPVILMMVFGLITAVALNQRVNWRQFMTQQIERNPRTAQMTPEQKEQQIEVGAKYAPYTSYIFGVPAPIIVVLIVALVMLGAYNLLGGANVNFKTSLAIVSHAYVPNFLFTLLFLVVLFVKPPGDMDMNNPVATNVASFLPDSIPKWLEALCKNIDIFSIWILILISVGFAAANPKKLKGAKSLTIAASMLALYVVLRVGFAFIFS